MPRKEQITVTLDKFLLEKLRKIAEQREESLSSVIESYLRASGNTEQSTETKQVLDILSQIKASLPEIKE